MKYNNVLSILYKSLKYVFVLNSFKFIFYFIFLILYSILIKISYYLIIYDYT